MGLRRSWFYIQPLLSAVWGESHCVSPHSYSYRGKGQWVWLRILVNKKITAAEVTESESTNITPIFCVLGCDKSKDFLANSALIDIQCNWKHSAAQRWKKPRKKKRDNKSIHVKSVLTKVNRPRSSTCGQEHKEDTKFCINIQNPFSGSAILHTDQLILCQLLTIGFLAGIEQVFMKNSNPWSHKSCFPPKNCILPSW